MHVSVRVSLPLVSVHHEQVMARADGQSTTPVPGGSAGEQHQQTPVLAVGVAADSATQPASSPSAVAQGTSQPLVVILYGPPLAGTSTQAAMLGSRYGLPIVTVDGLLQEAYFQLQSLQQTEAASASGAAGVGAASPRPSREQQLLEQLSKTLFCTVPHGVDDPRASASARVSSAASSHSAALSQQPEAHQKMAKAELLHMGLQWVLQQECYSKGFIVDGLGSRHVTSAAVVARCVLQAVGLTCQDLQHAEGNPVAGQAAAATAKAAKAASRPPSSRPGKLAAAAAAAPEPVPPILTFSKPDIWDGPVQVGQLFALG